MASDKKKSYSLSQIKSKLNCTSKELAVFLGISRSAMAMTESGLRALPDKAIASYNKLQEMLAAAESMPLPKEPEAYKLSKAELAAFEKRKKSAEKKSLKLSKEIKAMEAEIKKCKEMDVLIAQMTLNNLNPDKAQKQLMDTLMATNELNKIHNGREYQIMMSAKLAGVQMEIKMIEKVLADGFLKSNLP